MGDITCASSCSSPLARNQAFDVVLVDTAGRMQDNAPLMTALAKLIAVNMPDLVLFVGEALVGNEAVDQLVRPCMRKVGLRGGFVPKSPLNAVVFPVFNTVNLKEQSSSGRKSVGRGGVKSSLVLKSCLMQNGSLHPCLIST